MTRERFFTPAFEERSLFQGKSEVSTDDKTAAPTGHRVVHSFLSPFMSHFVDLGRARAARFNGRHCVKSSPFSWRQQQQKEQQTL